MNEFVELLILAYFREYKTRYSASDLAYKLGVTLDLLNSYIEELLEKEELFINRNMILISKKGRLVLDNSDMENYSFDSESYLIDGVKEKWPKEKVYPIHSFSKNKWRGVGK